MGDFVQLHLHSMYSVLDAMPAPKDYAKRAAEYGHEYLAITDHGKANAFFYLQEACHKNKLKPIFGIEMYVNNNLVSFSEKEKRVRTRDSHLILLAKNKTGYDNLLYLNWLSMNDRDHYYYNPRVTVREILDHSDGLIVGSACINSPIGKLLRVGNIKAAYNLVKFFKETLRENFYIEVQLNELTSPMDELKQGQKTYNNTMIAMARKLDIPVVLTGDVHYLDRGQDKLQTISIAIRNKDTMDNITFELESKNLYYHNVEDYLRFNKEFGYNYDEKDIVSWCSNSCEIAKMTSFELPKRKKMFLPNITEDDNATLEQKAKDGLARKMMVNTYEEVPENYRKRLEYELEVIERKGFSSYFLIYEDIYRFVREKKFLCGSSRGSGAGSLILYAIDASKIDPLKYDLLFERFLSEARCSDMVMDFFDDLTEG